MVNEINATAVKKMNVAEMLIKAYNFFVWFFMRDSWMALVPRWGGTLMLILTALRLAGIIK